MERVEIRLHARDLATRLSDMRTWLDRHGCELLSFALNRGADGVKAVMTFRQATDAMEFAEQFGGHQNSGQGELAEAAPGARSDQL